MPHADGRGVRARFDAHRRRRAAARRRDDTTDDRTRWYDFVDPGGCIDPFDGVVALVLVLGIVLAVVLFVFGGPVLLIGIDLVWFVVAFVAGTLGRFVLGRPWSVEAVDGAGARRVWKVKGFGDAGRLRDRLQVEFDAGLDPHPDRHPDRLA